MFIAPLLFAAALTPASPSTEAYVNAVPVQVASCSVSASLTSISGSYFGPIATNAGSFSLNIAFVDRDSKPIAKVEFAVRDGDTTVPVIDKGTFSAGVAINHTFSEPALTGGEVSCAVRSVAFADGSVWPAQQTQIGSK